MFPNSKILSKFLTLNHLDHNFHVSLQKNTANFLVIIFTGPWSMDGSLCILTDVPISMFNVLYLIYDGEIKYYM